MIQSNIRRGAAVPPQSMYNNAYLYFLRNFGERHFHLQDMMTTQQKKKTSRIAWHSSRHNEFLTHLANIMAWVGTR